MELSLDTQRIRRVLFGAQATRLGLVGSLLYAATGQPHTGAALVLAALLLLRMVALRLDSRRFIDQQIARRLGVAGLRGWPVHTKVYPGYRLVDISQAVAALAGTRPGSLELRSQHREGLAEILGQYFYGADNRKLKSPPLVARKVSYDQETYLPSDTFWVVPAAEQLGGVVVRVKLQQYTQNVQLEVAAAQAEQASQQIEAIEEYARLHSIFRHRLLEVTFDEQEGMNVVFHRDPEVTEADIVLDPQLRAIVERTVVDFHRRRAQLMRAGLPGKRGVLFYGPPGTGKTYTCKFLARQLVSVTTIAVTGRQLVEIGAICEVARLLQPAIVLLEDVDLIFSDRENNQRGGVLGELMDELDGFGENDQLIFVLTTNAIERVEAAIKDRPGRVSQCIYFGPPGAELRERYLRQLTRSYDTTALDMERVVSKTAGSTQAFLKELVFRAVQIASARLDPEAEHIPLSNRDVDVALKEMTTSGGRSGKRIIGFHVDELAVNGAG